MRKSQSTVILTIVIMAVFLAIGSFLAWSYLQRRPEVPAGTRQTLVEGVEVVINMDPSKQIRLVNMPPVQTEIQAPKPTAVPVPDQPAQEPQPPLPTATLPPPPPLPTAAPSPDPIIFIDYVVQPNEYLYDIARRMDTSITLMAQERISQENLIPGQVIRLPIGNPAYCPGRRPYAVGEGDTVYRISRLYNVSIEEIQAINQLDANFTILAAQIICVP